MSETVTTRTKPRIILVPPRPGRGVPLQRILGPAGACLAGGGGFLMLFLRRWWWPLWWWWSVMMPIFMVVAVIVVITRRRANRAHRARRSAFLAKHPDVEHDPLTMAVAKTWKEPDRIPKLEDVQTALSDEGRAVASDHATIVSFGVHDIPDVGNLHFEPHIITPTESVGRQFIWLAIAGVLLIACLSDCLDILPFWIPPTQALLPGMAFFFTAGLIALVLWIWKGMIRPTYIRLAPGIIQVLQYRSAKAKPIIRDYPMEAGTLAVLTRLHKALTVTVARDGQKDTLELSRMRQSEQWLERTWQTLLSTAPTPPLCDEELVG